MEFKPLNTRIVLRNDSTAGWTAVEADDISVLLKGEIGVEFNPDEKSDNSITKFKIGDGIHTWKDLPYYEETFEKDFVFTNAFGKYLPDETGSVTIAAKGKTMSELLLDAYATEKTDIDIVYPTVSLSAQKIASYEVGTKVAPSYSVTFNEGSYEFGPATGIVADSYTVTFDNQTLTTKNGTFSEVEIGDNFNKKITATATYYESDVNPVSNLGNPLEDKKISNDGESMTTAAVESGAISGYRNSWYYVGEDCDTEINSNFIRTNGSSKNKNTTSFGTITIPGGTKRVMIAIPGAHTLTSVIDVDGMGLDVSGNFKTLNNIAVNGANGYKAADYTVFVCDKVEGLAATKYTFSIK